MIEHEICKAFGANTQVRALVGHRTSLFDLVEGHRTSLFDLVESIMFSLRAWDLYWQRAIHHPSSVNYFLDEELLGAQAGRYFVTKELLYDLFYPAYCLHYHVHNTER